MFVTFEGIDGMGKTTQIRLLAEWLQTREVPVLLTREPGGTPFGEAIRPLLLDSTREQLADKAALFLLFAARVQHIEAVIQPALRQKKWILCDRFTDATYAYQGGGRGIAFATIQAMEHIAQGDFQPDMTFVFDANVSVSLDRIRKRGTKQDRFEEEDTIFFERVRAVYLARAQENPKQYCIVDATGTPEEVHQHIVAICEQMLRHARS